MAELKLSGNHLKGSRPVLSFDQVCCSRCCSRRSLVEPLRMGSRTCFCTWTTVCSEIQTLLQSLQSLLLQTFEEAPHWQLLKEVLTHVFATPKRHHRSKPFFDHVIAFTVADGRVWLRNYQVGDLASLAWHRCCHQAQQTALGIGGSNPRHALVQVHGSLRMCVHMCNRRACCHVIRLAG